MTLMVIEETVVLEEGVEIGPFCVLKGNTYIGKNTRIGAGCVLNNTKIGENCTLLPYTIAESAHIEDHCQVGPFAHLRPQTHLKTHTKVGNFVEMKNTTLGAYSKANHLAYVGDSVVGEHCNIGAGVITCNYDGIKKHQTQIQDHVFVGSNSTLIAPVTLEEGAYIAAGSTIHQTVPKEALGIARTRQENKLGYAKKLKRLS